MSAVDEKIAAKTKDANYMIREETHNKGAKEQSGTDSDVLVNRRERMWSRKNRVTSGEKATVPLVKKQFNDYSKTLK